jgi:hypothetical protein
LFPLFLRWNHAGRTTRKIGFRNGYLEPVFKKQVLKDESGVFIYFIKIIRTGFA